MTFEINGPVGIALPVTLHDVVRTLTTQYPDLQWTIREFYGRGRMDVSYPGDRTYREFSDYLDSREVILDSGELAEVALATDDIYDVLLVGVRQGDVGVQYDGRDPWERFWTLADQHDVVAECVDSGFWRISIRDDVRAEEVRRSVAVIHGVIVTDLSRHR